MVKDGAATAIRNAESFEHLVAMDTPEPSTPAISRPAHFAPADPGTVEPIGIKSIV
jgi:hypothetical protein